ncbi:MAG: amidophosphoribosyltransferase, partial [Phycisphaerae bacterium]
LCRLRGDMAIGHNRYSTTGSSTVSNAQPLLVEYARGQVAICHNGNLINADLLRRTYQEHGHIFQTTSDTEIIIHLLAHPDHMDLPDPLGHVLTHLQGAFSLLALFPDRLEAARDPHGIRPLCIGRLPNGSYCVASETIALDVLEANYIRDVRPGEIVTLDDTGLHSRLYVDPAQYQPAACIFELVYFADPSSDVFAQNVHLARLAMGRQLARQAPADADLVVPVPNCARCAAIGYSQASGIPFGRAFTTSHYTGRSFIMPNQTMRDLVVRMKLNVIRQAVRGKRLVVVEDSIVRGTTTKGKLGALRRAGARQIHVRVASPPIRHPCHYGIDFPTTQELVAIQKGSVQAIRDYLEVDSLAYLSLEGMLSCVNPPPAHYCTACFSGQYPIPIDHQVHKFALERYQLPMFD